MCIVTCHIRCTVQARLLNPWKHYTGLVARIIFGRIEGSRIKGLPEETRASSQWKHRAEQHESAERSEHPKESLASACSFEHLHAGLHCDTTQLVARAMFRSRSAYRAVRCAE